MDVPSTPNLEPVLPSGKSSCLCQVLPPLVVLNVAAWLEPGSPRVIHPSSGLTNAADPITRVGAEAPRPASLATPLPTIAAITTTMAIVAATVPRDRLGRACRGRLAAARRFGVCSASLVVNPPHPLIARQARRCRASVCKTNP